MLKQADQLSRISIRGFKSIKSCDLDLAKINVLIGSNGSGKSNFISAFSFLHAILGKELQIAVGKSGLNSLLYKGRKTTEEIAFEVFFGTNSYGFNLLATDDNSLVFQKEFFRHGNKELKVNVLGHGHRESRWEERAEEKAKQDMTRILKKQNWRVYHFHDTGQNARIKQEHNISNNQTLFPDAANLAAFLYRIKNIYPKNYREIVQTIQLIAPYFADFVLLPQEGNKEQINLKWQEKGCEDIFNASQLSDGTLRFICLTTLLLQPDALQPATIIIDEPELGLHPYAITVFAEMAQSLPAGKQIIISTQSVELLDEFDVTNIIVVNRKDSGSEFTRLKEAELALWLEEDYALGELWKKNLLGGRLSQ